MSPVHTIHGLFSVRDVGEAAEAIAEIHADYRTHSLAAREIAAQYLSPEKMTGELLNKIGLA